MIERRLVGGLACLAWLVACSSGGESSACSWYVSASSGHDGAAGSAGDPLRLITDALDRAMAGDVVCVGPGGYGTGETLPLAIPAHVKLIATSGPSSTTLTGSGEVTALGARAAVIAGDASILQAFTIRIPASDPGPVQIGVLTAEGSAEVRGNAIEDIGWGLAGGAGVASTNEASPLLDGNEISGCHDGIATFDSSAPVIRNNTLVDNENNGVYAAEQSIPDLGRAGSPGRNRIQSNGTRGLYNYTTASAIPAAGNTWNTNCTTDAAGKYAAHLVSGPADDATACMGGESNYKIQVAGAAIQF